MARYESIIKLSGTIDNLVFYQLNGVNVVRKKSGFNTADFKKKKSYQKVRENSTEFGHCSKTGKMLRDALQDYVTGNGDKYLYQKFAKLMTAVKDLDLSERGKRTVLKGLAKPEAAQLLKGFTFGEFENVEKYLLKTEGLFSITLQQTAPTDADELELVTLRPDFTAYQCEKKSQTMPANQSNVYEFEKYFGSDDALLYFAVFKKKNEILKLGFI